MSTVQELLAQKATLDAQIKQAKAEAFAGVVATVAGLCADHDIGLDEMASALTTLHNRRQRAGTKAPAKFRNTATGKTWSGRGKQPAWVGGEHSVAV
jgi:DNA-binding protein H-NS